MTNAKISDGIAHQLPDDLKTVLQADKSLLERWEDLTPLARNEWICWTVTCKRSETRAEHIRRVRTELLAGKRRPCCWAGCPHRTDKAMNATQKWLLEKQNK
ncbi:YdeI/OmpD-associated family protein [Candidatus Saccharibacteria bacterium]|nr:YdeI/OmpD-associated family protein [Candidatus Saccharibacteria bacterium]MCA9337696.1 YdeI/OmpD-associated family protein [Candidatus Saccharibacteria bacterium]